MSHRILSSTLGLALILTPAALAQGKLTATPPQKGCAGLQVLAPSQSELARVFSARKVIDLQIRVLLAPDTRGQHLVRLKLFEPQGNLYQTLVTPLKEAADPSATRSVQGYPLPVRTRPMQALTLLGKPVLGVDVPFPVGGTDIVANGLYGTWRVEAYLDGAETPCVAPVSFAISN